MLKSDQAIDTQPPGGVTGNLLRLLQEFIRENLAVGRLRVTLPNGSAVCASVSEEPRVDLSIDDWRSILLIFLYPSYYLPEALVRRRIKFNFGSMDDLLRMFMAFPERTPALPLRERWLREVGAWKDRMFGAGSERRASSDVRFHYNLSNEFFHNFLDENMQYSCGFFDPWESTLDAAQLCKMSIIDRKLTITSNSKVLDIGCGWGGLAKFIARKHGARVTGITLSDQQFRYATAETQVPGVKFELSDYRNHSGIYDRVVSVGMLEHVGREHYPEFFGCVSKLLSTDGVALIHSIGRAGHGGPINPWLRRHIFPGTYLPLLSDLISAAEKANLWIVDVDNWRLHYAQTLAHWVERVEKRKSEVIAEFGEEFLLAWRFYLRSCELGFRHQGLTVYQLLLTHKPEAVPLNRRYMYESS